MTEAQYSIVGHLTIVNLHLDSELAYDYADCNLSMKSRRLIKSAEASEDNQRLSHLYVSRCCEQKRIKQSAFEMI